MAGQCIWVLVLCALLATPARAAFELTRSGDVFTVQASAVIAARPDQIWQVLTDYDHIGTFVPGISSSRVIEGPSESAARGAERILLVEQKGGLGLAFFPLNFLIDLRVVEHPFDRIEIERVAGSARQYRAQYQIEEAASGQTRLLFSALIESDRFIPPLLGTSLMRGSLSRQFEALVQEVKRRALIRSPGSGAPGG